MVKEKEFETLKKVQQWVLDHKWSFEKRQEIITIINAQDWGRSPETKEFYDLVYSEIWQHYFQPALGSPRLQEIYAFLKLMNTSNMTQLCQAFLNYPERDITKVEEVKNGMYNIEVYDIDLKVKQRIDICKEKPLEYEMTEEVRHEIHERFGENIDPKSYEQMQDYLDFIFHNLWMPFLVVQGTSIEINQMLEHLELPQQTTLNELARKLWSFSLPQKAQTDISIQSSTDGKEGGDIKEPHQPTITDVIFTLIDKFEVIHDENGKKVNPMPEDKPITVYFQHEGEEGIEANVLASELGISAMLAKRWILQEELEKLIGDFVPNE